MSKSKKLTAFLESSLNEIFKATVSDILESVEETLSEYQGRIQRIETENEDLRRRLQKRDEEQDASEKTAEEETSALHLPESERRGFLKDPHAQQPIVSIQRQVIQPKLNDGKLGLAERRRYRQRARESFHHKAEPPVELGPEAQSTSGLEHAEKPSSRAVSPVKFAYLKNEPDPEDGCVIDLSKTQSPLNLATKLIKTERNEPEYTSREHYADPHSPRCSDPNSGDSDCDSGPREWVQLERKGVWPQRPDSRMVSPVISKPQSQRQP
ncbi:hypothetical protein MATL_G00082870 [Megalops atlanticus]|uniref:Uncharacterized protein n=1 Tax=Megalops atlanticus TaxID=7932 RepID=A0A9D3TAS8_MEGAT|nr:hypothetical protein MATL_G00082870 [Megalops atlanticus]